MAGKHFSSLFAILIYVINMWGWKNRKNRLITAGTRKRGLNLESGSNSWGHTKQPESCTGGAARIPPPKSKAVCHLSYHWHRAWGREHSTYKSGMAELKMLHQILAHPFTCQSWCVLNQPRNSSEAICTLLLLPCCLCRHTWAGFTLSSFGATGNVVLGQFGELCRLQIWLSPHQAATTKLLEIPKQPN